MEKSTLKNLYRGKMVRFCFLSLIPSIIILLLPLSKWSALIWTGGFIGGSSVFGIMGIGAVITTEKECRKECDRRLTQND